MYVLLHGVGYLHKNKITSSIEKKGRERCELPSALKIDEIESSMTYCMYVGIIVL